MAREFKARIANLGKYMMKQESIVDVVLTAIEDHDLMIFERVRSENFKNQVVREFEDMWEQAAVLAQEDTSQTRCSIRITLDSIEHTHTCLALGGWNWLGWISYHIDLMRYYRRKLPLVAVLAMHIAEKGNNLGEKEELLQQIRQRIVTKHDLYFSFEADVVRKEAPAEFPPISNGMFCPPFEIVPYLVKICQEFKRRRYSEQELQEVWKVMLEKKAHAVDSLNWHGYLPPEDALLVLFENLTYKEVKYHEQAYFRLIQEPEEFYIEILKD